LGVGGMEKGKGEGWTDSGLVGGGAREGRGLGGGSELVPVEEV
jgi:hypothetical protein